MATDGLEWVLSWRQIGVRNVTVGLLGNKATEQWEELQEDFGSMLPGIIAVEHSWGDSPWSGSDVVCFTLGRDVGESAGLLQELEAVNPEITLLGTSTSVNWNKRKVWKKDKCSRCWSSLQAKHASLGGLTKGRFWLVWSLGGKGKDNQSISLPLGSVSRDRTKFLEPSAGLGTWFRSDAKVEGPIWDTVGDESGGSVNLAPWPVKDHLCLRVYSVLVKSVIFRGASDKEWAQLLDLRPEWGSRLRKCVSGWRDKEVIPLRMLVELGMAGMGGRPVTTAIESKGFVEADFGRQLSPDLIPGTVEEKVDKMKYFGWCWEEEDAVAVGVATTSDDAEVKEDLWAVGGNDPVDGNPTAWEEARERLRRCMWRWWLRKQTKDALAWLQQRKDTHPTDQGVDRAGVRDCIERLAGSTWFEWNDGSRLHFWNWPERWLEEARDGARPFVFSVPEPRLKWPRMPQEEWVLDLEVSKLAKLIRRRYLEDGWVEVVIPRFGVPKGDNDIRVVWDMTKNLVNPCMFISTFFLLNIYSLNLRLHPDQFCADFDCGEMFNTFPLWEEVRKYFGVEFSPELRKKLAVILDIPEESLPRFMRWARLPFGWTCAPFFAIRMMMRAIELAKGHPSDKKSAFCFERVILNLPGMDCYDPGLPRVYKLRFDGLTACEVFVFVDDGRVLGPNDELTRAAMRQVVTSIQGKGIQDAARKRDGVSQRPRAWTGGVTHMDKGMIRKFLVKKKWGKMSDFLGWVCTHKLGDPMDRKRFHSGLGFMVHASATYDFIRPYLIGFYLAMNRWRGERDQDGWKVAADSLSADLDCDNLEEMMSDELDSMADDGAEREDSGLRRRSRSEDTTEPVPMTELLLRNAETLKRLIVGENPLRILVRPVRGRGTAAYAGADASGEGFGVRDSVGENGGVFTYGYWNGGTDDSSSNWREMKAVLDKIRRDAEDGRMAGREIWFGTDNSTLERAYYKGYSQSIELYRMVEELRALTLMGGFTLHIVHIAGTRMIDTGIDGLSRGEIDFGLLTKSLKGAIPLHKSPLERSPALLDWIRSWTGHAGMPLRVASPMDWHYNAHQSDAVTLDAVSETWLWDLPPAAALHALEELGNARTKRRELLKGVVIIPGLMAPEWYRRFSKVVDIYFRVPAGALPEWDETMHEGLTIGIYLPNFECKPWDWNNVEWMGSLGRTLCSMHKEDPTRGRDLLSKFWGGAHAVPNLPPRLVWHLLSGQTWLPLCGYGSRRR